MPFSGGDFMTILYRFYDVDIHFDMILEDFWHYFSIFFRHRFVDVFLDTFFRVVAEDGSKNDPKKYPRNEHSAP